VKHIPMSEIRFLVGRPKDVPKIEEVLGVDEIGYLTLSEIKEYLRKLEKKGVLKG